MSGPHTRPGRDQRRCARTSTCPRPQCAAVTRQAVLPPQRGLRAGRSSSTWEGLDIAVPSAKFAIASCADRDRIGAARPGLVRGWPRGYSDRDIADDAAAAGHRRDLSP